jgi:hypothetical protein
MEPMELQWNYPRNYRSPLYISLSQLFIFILYTLVPQVPKIPRARKVLDFANLKNADFFQKADKIFARKIYGTYGTKKKLNCKL